MSKLIIFAVVWNDMDWLKAMIEHIEYWNPDRLYFCEGCFDKKFPARSTDGTREYLMKYKNTREHTYVLDNIRDQDYRMNQAMTCNQVLQLSDIQTGDWIMRVDCDAFYLKAHIDQYKKLMETSYHHWVEYEIWNFWDSVTKYYPHWTKYIARLPFRYIKGATFKPTWVLHLDGKPYHESNTIGVRVAIKELHYEGMREPKRLKDKYAVGDRQSPEVWKGGCKLKNRQIYTGPHSEFAIPVLRKKGFM